MSYYCINVLFVPINFEIYNQHKQTMKNEVNLLNVKNPIIEGNKILKIQFDESNYPSKREFFRPFPNNCHATLAAMDFEQARRCHMERFFAVVLMVIPSISFTN